MIDVNGYLAFNTGKDSQSRTIKWMVLKYFKKYPDAIFKNQTEFAAMLAKEFNVSHISQSGLSKALKHMDKTLRINGKTYFFEKMNGEYQLNPEDERIKKLYDFKGIFDRERVLRISDNVLSMLIKNGEKGERFIKKLKELFEGHEVFSVLYCDKMLFLLFDNEHQFFKDTFQGFLNFFKSREAWIKEQEERKKRETAAKQKYIRMEKSVTPSAESTASGLLTPVKED